MVAEKTHTLQSELKTGFGFSSRSYGYVMFWFAGAGGRSGVVGILVGEVKEAIYINKIRLIKEPRTRIAAAPDLPPAPASWAVPTNQNITWSKLLGEKPKRREDFFNYDPRWVKIYWLKNNSVILNLYAVSEPQWFQFIVNVERCTCMIAMSFGCTTNRTSRNKVCGWSQLNLRNSFNITVATRWCGRSRLPVPIAGIAIDCNFILWTARKQLQRNWLKVCNIAVMEWIYVRE